jgi:hypothetical protein
VTIIERGRQLCRCADPGRLCGPRGPVILLFEGRLAKIREELVEAIKWHRLRRGNLDA